MVASKEKEPFNINRTQFFVAIGAWLLVLLLRLFDMQSTRSAAEDFGLMLIGVTSIRAVVLLYIYILHREEAVKFMFKHFPALANNPTEVFAQLTRYYLKRWITTVLLGFIASILFYAVVSTDQNLFVQNAAAVLIVGTWAIGVYYQFSTMISASIKNRKIMWIFLHVT